MDFALKSATLVALSAGSTKRITASAALTNVNDALRNAGAWQAQPHESVLNGEGVRWDALSHVLYSS